MATDKKQLGIRFSSDRYEYIKQLEDELGISKNAVVEMLVDFYRTHTQSVSTFDKCSAGNGSSLNKSVSTSKSVSTLLKGLAATRAIELGTVHWLASGNTQVLWFDGWLWLVGKSANGSQKVIEQLFECPEVLFDGAGSTSFKLDQYVGAKANWDDLKALAGIELLDESWFQKGAYFFNDDRNWRSFSDHRVMAIEAIKLAKVKELAAIAEPVAALKVVHDVVAIDVVIEPASPLVEQIVEEMPIVEATQLALLELAEVLTASGFRARFGFDTSDISNKAYGLVINAGRGTEGYTAKDGSLWFVTGAKKQAVWTNCPAAIQIAETQVLAIV